MNRTYELVFVADPRLTDEQVVALTDDYKAMIKTAGGNVVREESWGKRKLAYPIDKLTEGQYVILYIETPDGVNPFPEVEQRLRQNEKILRYLTVRTDLDLKRAARKGKIKKPRTGPHAGIGGENMSGRGRKAPAPKTGRRTFFRRRKVCKFSADGIEYIDYKDVKLLRQFIPERAKILPRRISGNSARHQRMLAEGDQARAPPGAAPLRHRLRLR